MILKNNQGENMVKTMKDYKIETNHVPCFAHCLHNNVTQGIAKYGDSNNLRTISEEITKAFS